MGWMLESERTPPPSRDSYETSASRHYPKGRGGVALVLIIERLQHSTSAIYGKMGENKETVSQVD